MYFDRVRSGTCEIKLPLFLFGFLSYELNFKKLLGSAGSFGNLWVALALFQNFLMRISNFPIPVMCLIQN